MKLQITMEPNFRHHRIFPVSGQEFVAKSFHSDSVYIRKDELFPLLKQLLNNAIRYPELLEEYEQATEENRQLKEKLEEAQSFIGIRDDGEMVSWADYCDCESEDE